MYVQIVYMHSVCIQFLWKFCSTRYPTLVDAYSIVGRLSLSQSYRSWPVTLESNKVMMRKRQICNSRKIFIRCIINLLRWVFSHCFFISCTLNSINWSILRFCHITHIDPKKVISQEVVSMVHFCQTIGRNNIPSPRIHNYARG